MSYTTTTKLLLEKAVPGTNQPFETASINNNWDKIDTAVKDVIATSSVASSIVRIDGGTA